MNPDQPTRTNSTRELATMALAIWDPERLVTRWEEPAESVTSRSSEIAFAEADADKTIQWLVDDQRRTVDFLLKQREHLDDRRSALVTLAFGAIPVVAATIGWTAGRHAIWASFPAVILSLAAVAIALRARWAMSMRGGPSVRSMIEKMPDGCTLFQVKRVTLNGLIFAAANIRADINLMSAQINATAGVLLAGALAVVAGLALAYFFGSEPSARIFGCSRSHVPLTISESGTIFSTLIGEGFEGVAGGGSDLSWSSDIGIHPV